MASKKNKSTLDYCIKELEKERNSGAHFLRTPMILLEQYRKECKKDKSITPEELSEKLDAIESVSFFLLRSMQAAKANEIDYTGHMAFGLGMALSRLLDSKTDELLERYEEADHKRLKPFREKARIREIIKTAAQGNAEELWSKDTNQEIRIGAMAKKVRPQMVTALDSMGKLDLLPSDEKIKEWLKPIAPDYARQGGRPKKRR